MASNQRLMMNNKRLMVVAMAEECRRVIQWSDEANCLLPSSLHPTHLVWMCDRIEQHVEDWPATRLHRWIGFVQSGMMANRMLDLKSAKSMFDPATKAHANGHDHKELADHLDSESSIRRERNGES